MSLITTGLGRAFLAGRALKLFTFLMHVQLIKLGQNFKAWTILWTDYKFYVCSPQSIIKTCCAQGVITERIFCFERRAFSPLHSPPLGIRKTNTLILLMQIGPCFQRFFFVGLRAFSVPIDLSNWGQQRLCEKVHFQSSKEIPSFGENCLKKGSDTH